MTAAQFLELPQTTTRIELIDGVVIYPFGPPPQETEFSASPAPEIDHQLLAGALYTRIGQAVTGGTVLFALVDIHLDDDLVIQPDVMWIAPGSRCVLEDGRYRRAAPDLVVEVLSPGTAYRDQSVKFHLYEEYGAREYWIADPAGGYLEVWTAVEGHFTRQGVYGPREVFHSPLLAVAIDLGGVFPER
jgi:Uma2 family endonuclease